MRAAVAALLLAGADAAHERVWSSSFVPAHKVAPLLRVRGSPTAWGLCGDLALGSPPQYLRVAFESTDPLTWVWNAHYDHARSSSYEADGREVIEIGNYYKVKGFQSRDSLRFDARAIANVTFIEATDVSIVPNVPWVLPVEGVFGFAPDLEQNMAVRQILQVGELDKPVFALYLSKQAQQAGWTTKDVEVTRSVGVEYERAGELVIGAIDNRRYTGDVHYVNTIGPTAWVVALDGVTITSDSAHENLARPSDPESMKASVWPTYPLILGPPDLIAKLAKAVGADVGGTIDCSSVGPDIEFHIGGRKFTLTKADYTLPIPVNGAKRCRWAFEGAHVGGWFFGQTFLQKFYTVFVFGTEDKSNPPRIGFALAV